MCGVATLNRTKVKVRQLLREIWPIKRGWDMKKPSHGRPDLLLSLRDLPESCLRTADRTITISRNLRLCGLYLSWQLLMFQYFRIISRLCFHLPLNLFKSFKCERFLSSPKLPSWLWVPPSLPFSGYWSSYSRNEGTGAGGPKLKELVELYLHFLTFLRGVRREKFTFNTLISNWRTQR